MTTVGVPRETKSAEHRVAITPDGVAELVHHGVEVLVESGAGEGAALADSEHQSAGAKILTEAADVWGSSSIICKVKEPQESEVAYLHSGLTLFTYLHLAGYPAVASWLLERNVTAIAYETVQTESGDLPLLAPMSEVAGRMAPQLGAHHLQRNSGGRGVLLSGVTGVEPGWVVVLGAGNVGWNAAVIASGMGAEVQLLDLDLDRLRWADDFGHGRITTLASNRGAVARAVAQADLVIGAVLVAGGRAPTVVTEEMVAAMKPGSVIIDIAVDQGGCIATTRETTHDEPTYVEHGVIHYTVGNVPATVPRTSTFALTNATLPYLRELALAPSPIDACRSNPVLGRGLNTHAGAITHATVASALNTAYQPLD